MGKAMGVRSPVATVARWPRLASYGAASLATERDGCPLRARLRPLARPPAHGNASSGSRERLALACATSLLRDRCDRLRGSPPAAIAAAGVPAAGAGAAGPATAKGRGARAG